MEESARKRYGVSVSLDGETVKRLDDKRGQVPRSRYLETMALRGMESTL